MEYNITDATFKEEIKEGLVLVDFWATPILVGCAYTSSNS